MTAVVGILNKTSVAIAADSAVTVGGSKIYNTANKIFSLSKHHPVGIALYNNASFMGMPWEVLIKTYRSKLGINKFDTLVEYKEDFLSFIEDQLPTIVSENAEKSSLYWLAISYIKEILNRSVSKIDTNDFQSKDEYQNLINRAFVEEIIEFENILEIEHILESFKHINIEEVSTRNKNIIIQALDDSVGDLTFTDEEKNCLVRTIISYLTKDITWGIENVTGLVFVGYGEKEYYPCCVSVKVGQVFERVIRIRENSTTQISDDNQSSVLPFAQTDVIMSFIRGIDEELENVYLDAFKEIFSDFKKGLSNLIGKTHTDIAKQIDDIPVEDITNEFKKVGARIVQFKHIQPTLDSVVSLSKEDLAEMAESLIYLTYLKRRISFAQESVGGPIDVAVISKGDGFIWIKRKHYFKPELNYNFFQNYLKDN